MGETFKKDNLNYIFKGYLFSVCVCVYREAGRDKKKTQQTTGSVLPLRQEIVLFPPSDQFCSSNEKKKTAHIPDAFSRLIAL